MLRSLRLSDDLAENRNLHCHHPTRNSSNVFGTLRGALALRLSTKPGASSGLGLPFTGRFSDALLRLSRWIGLAPGRLERHCVRVADSDKAVQEMALRASEIS